MMDSMRRVCELAMHQASIARVHLENVVSILSVKVEVREGDELLRTLSVIETLNDLHKQLIHVECTLEKISKVDV